MAKTSFEFGAVNVLLFDPDLTSRNATKFALSAVGINNIEEYFSTTAMPESLVETDFDLIIFDCSTAGRVLFRLVEDIRNRRIGNNPFVPIVMTLWNPARQLVLDALGSGIDDLVMKPVSANVLMARINGLVQRRKPFVFDDDYVGPVRELTPDLLALKAPIEVPNALRAKATREPEEPITQELVDSIISFQRCRRLQARLQSMVNGLKDFFDNNGSDEFPVGLTTKLSEVADDLAEEAYLGAYLHIVELSKALKVVGGSLHRNGAMSSKRDMQLLEQTAEAIKIGLVDRHSAVDAASAIAQTIADAQRKRS